MKPGESRLAGFTVIEVLIAIAVVIVGASGLLALQGATTRGNQDAHEHTAATNFARTWVERVKIDAQRWITPTAAGLAATTYLSEAEGVWYRPTENAALGWRAGADYAGFDTEPPADETEPPIYYCANLRNNSVLGRAMRVDVRVYWSRAYGRTPDFTLGRDADTGECAPEPDELAVTALPDGVANATEPVFRWVFLSTVVNPTPPLTTPL